MCQSGNNLNLFIASAVNQVVVLCCVNESERESV